MAGEARGVQSIEVGGRLLAVLAEARQPLMLRELAERAEIAPAQAHAYLTSFRKQGLVEQDASAKRYRLGPFALMLGLARMRSFDPLRMAREAVTDLARETGLTVALVVWGSHGPTVIQIEEGADQVYTNTRAGTVYSISGTASGHVFAAHMPAPVIEAMLAQEAAEGRQTRRVGLPMAAGPFAKAVERARRHGFASIEKPPVPGVHAVSAPVFDHTGQLQMAVTLIGPAAVLDMRPESALAARLVAFTARLSEQLGHEPAA